MKKLVSVLFTIVFILTNILSINIVSAANTDIIVSYFTPMKGINSIDKAPTNERFDFWVTFENRSGGPISNVNVTFDQENSSFYVVDGSPVKYDIYMIEDVGTVIFPNLIHKGSGNKIVLIFDFKKDGNEESTVTKTLYIGVDSNNNGPINPGDNQYSFSMDPVIEISDNIGVPVLPAGKNIGFTLPIANISMYSALDVKISLDVNGPLSEYITFNELKPVKKLAYISPRRTEAVSFNVYVSKVIEPGIYPITINYSYYNVANKLFSSSETINIKVENVYTKPNLKVKEAKFVPEKIKVGEEVKLVLNIANEGSCEAKDVKVYVEDFEDDGYVVINSTNQKSVGVISGNTENTVTYTLLKVNNGQNPICSLRIKTEYKDEKGNTYSDITTVIPVMPENTEGFANLKFDKITAPVEEINAGEEFNVDVVIKNTGSGDAKNIKINLAPDSSIIPKSLSIITVDTIKAGESRSFSFKLSSFPDVLSKNYAIPINLEYETNNIKNSNTNYVGVNILNEKSKVKTVPKIIIDNYGFDTDKVNAGKEFDLYLSFFNTSKDLSVKNIKVTVMSNDGSFTPVNSSNTFYLDSIPVEGIVERSMRLYAKPDLNTKSYQMTVKLQYEDENGVQDDNTGRQYEAEEILSIPVVQEPRLQVNDINLPYQAFIGSPVYVYTQFYNMGRCGLHNLLVRMEGDFEGQDLNYFVGDFNQGSSDYYEGTIIPAKEGVLNGNLIFSFEDDIGNKSEIIKEFSMNVVQNNPSIKEVYGEYGKDVYGTPEPPAKKSKIGLIAIGATGLVVVLTVIIIIVRKNKSKKEGLESDE